MPRRRPYTPRLLAIGHIRAATLVFLACLGVYVAGLCPSPYWLDSSELATAAFELGVAHPPGHPLHALIGKAFCLLPLGSVAFRVGLASAFLGALAAALVTLVAAALAAALMTALDEQADADARARPPERDVFVESALGVAAGLGFGFCYAAAFQSVRPEVYALNAALLLGAARCLLAYDETRRPRWLHLAALCVGLGLANHHLLAAVFAVAASPFALAIALRRTSAASSGASVAPSRNLPRVLGYTALAGLLALALYAYLPLRALHRPTVNWGSPSTLSRFFWTVSAQAFQKSVAHAGQTDPAAVIFALAEALALLAPLALLGAYLLLRLRATRRLGLFLVAAAVLDALVPAAVGFDPQNPDAHGYLEPAVAFFAAAAAAGLAGLFAMTRAHATPAFTRTLRRLVLAAVVAIAAVAARPLPSLMRTRFADTDRVYAQILDETPPRALLMTSYFQSAFALFYLRVVEGSRPDVDLLHRHFLGYPGYREDVLARSPSLATLLDGGRADASTFGLVNYAHRRAVLLEYDLDLDLSLVKKLLPDAQIDRLSPSPPSPNHRAEADFIADERRTALRRRLDLDEPQTRRAVLWSDFLAASRDCSAGNGRYAQPAIARARALLDGAVDPDLEHLAAGCDPRAVAPVTAP